MKTITQYFFAILALVICVVAWWSVFLAERFTENPHRFRSFRVDQADLWDHLTRNKP